MRLILTDDEGTLLDMTEVTPEEWKAAQTSSLAALTLLSEMQAGEQ